jgi:hypothetical protein
MIKVEFNLCTILKFHYTDHFLLIRGKIEQNNRGLRDHIATVSGALMADRRWALTVVQIRTSGMLHVSSKFDYQIL